MDNKTAKIIEGTSQDMVNRLLAGGSVPLLGPGFAKNEEESEKPPLKVKDFREQLDKLHDPATFFFNFNNELVELLEKSEESNDTTPVGKFLERAHGQMEQLKSAVYNMHRVYLDHFTK